MDYIEISGKTVDDALTEALVKLETTSRQSSVYAEKRIKTS